MVKQGDGIVESNESSSWTDYVSRIENYSYSDDKKGNIEIRLFVDEPGRHQLVIREKNLERMQTFAEIGKKISKGEM